jgi:hypothetical protein
MMYTTIEYLGFILSFPVLVASSPVMGLLLISRGIETQLLK